MSSQTENYHLIKHDSTDDYEDFRAAYNGNMDIIDQNLGGGGGGGGHTIVDPTGTEVAQEPKMQFTGKVDVSDDSTNQKTIVNMPAEVVPITRAEYEALPDTKLTDGKAYFITDGSSAKVQGYPPLIYSKYEREIGCWLNGKPLYKKAFSINAQSNTISTSLLNNLDIQFVTNLYLIVWQSQNFYVDFNIKWNSNTKLLILPSTSVFVLALVVEYTKTTDTAGSGIWNGQGGIACHYSTNETVIGTWIDGKPIYECVFDFGSNIVISNGGFTNTSINASTMKVLIGAKGIYSTGITVYNLMANINNNIIRLQADRHDNGASVRYVILQYTKTTD